MDFSLTDDRRMLADTLDRYLSAEYPWEHRLKVSYKAPYHDPAKYAELAELGVIGALVSEDAGGFGGAGFDIMVVFERLGRALCPEPMMPTLLALRLLEAAAENLEAVIAGERRPAVAIGELEAPYDVAAIETTATGANGSMRLTGRKSVVYGGHGASEFLVAARNGDTVGLYTVDGSNARTTGYAMIDGGNAAELFLDDSPATELIADAAAPIEAALDAGRLALCAEAVGAMDASFDTLLEYLKTRKQFGKAIGSFQVLQHRMVDLKIEIEQARSITILAASKLGTEEGPRTVAMAKNLIGRVAKLVGEESIQMHGGIAMTWEYPASHYAKRLVMLDAQLGDTDYQLEKVMAAHAA